MLRGEDIRDALEDGERTAWLLLGKLFFLSLIGIAIVISVTTSVVLAAVLASVFASILLREILPDEKFRDWANDYWDGEGALRWRRRANAAGDAVVGAVRRLGAGLKDAGGFLKRLIPTP